MADPTAVRGNARTGSPVSLEHGWLSALRIGHPGRQPGIDNANSGSGCTGGNERAWEASD
jgi:hypothetical protein